MTWPPTSCPHCEAKYGYPHAPGCASYGRRVGQPAETPPARPVSHGDACAALLRELRRYQPGGELESDFGQEQHLALVRDVDSALGNATKEAPQQCG